MGARKRRELAGNTKPQNPRNKTAKWKLFRPSKYVRWIVVGPVENRAKRREMRKRRRKMFAK